MAFGLTRFYPAQQPLERVLGWRAAEALIVTLIASLWFDSLGHGAWWLVFLLIGAVIAVAALPARDANPRTVAVVACAELIRYMMAGALLAWRLG